MLPTRMRRMLAVLLQHLPLPICKIYNFDNIEFDPADYGKIFNHGCFFQAVGKIKIGKGTWLGPNVGILTTNHDYLGNLDKNIEPRPVTIGERCYIGMNSIILPGVVLGDRTVVGAGSVVTHSFPDGYCVLVGNPAQKIKYV